jgi:hypothetical protein
MTGHWPNCIFGVLWIICQNFPLVASDCADCAYGFFVPNRTIFSVDIFLAGITISLGSFAQ